MSAAQLGRRMGLSRQGVADLERREVGRVATLATLDKAAQAMDAELLNAIVPRTALTDALRPQAHKRAEQQIKRGAHRSTDELVRAITAYIAVTNRDPKPFIWTKTADDILASISRLCVRTSGSGH